MTNRQIFPELEEQDLRELTGFRHDLHRRPELSGHEAETAEKVRQMLQGLSPDRIISDLGGHGVAAVFDSGVAGPSIMFRAELDGLPIEDEGQVPYRSVVSGQGHLCGHDGHATILLGLARVLSRARPALGRVILLFQPAEEDGSGAAAVIDDPRFDEIRPDWAFALHNMPGIPTGVGEVGRNAANCASRGISITLTGSTAHASRPSDGRSPMRAMAELMPALEDLGSGSELGPEFSMVTLTHASMGARAFGIAPGEALIMATLRTVTDTRMIDLKAQAEVLVHETAERFGLGCQISYCDVFQACTNDDQARDQLAQGMQDAGVKAVIVDQPFLASEDFGRFGLAGARSAMVFLGAGVERPGLHTPDYDFNDDLIRVGVDIFTHTLSRCIEAN